MAGTVLCARAVVRRGLAALALGFLFCVCGGVAAQQVVFKQVEAAATGANELDAVAQALVSAVQQVNGTRVGGLTVSVVKESIRDSKLTTSADLARVAESVTRGAVKSYEIVESAKDTAAPWRVRIRANVAVYSAGDQIKRLRLAVVPVRVPPNLQGSGAARQFAGEFAEKLEVLLTQSRRFAMLDRQFTQAVDKELAQYNTAAFAPEETARIGKKAGTDYLVVGSLVKYEVVDQSIHMKMTGATIPQKSARAVIQVRLIDVATGQIKYAKTFDTGEQAARTAGSAQGLLGGMAEKAVSEILSAVYPLAIVALDASTVTLGQGGDTIQVGQRFQVFALGEPMKDPYTGESLGKRELPIGLVEVASTTDRVSTARIIDGATAIATNYGKEMIVRRAAPGVGAPTKAAPAKGTAQPARAQAAPGGGAPAAKAKKEEDW